MKKLILVSGPAGIGKSTFCKKYVEEHPNEEVRIISADEVRREMFGGYDQFPKGKNMMIIYEKMIERSTAFLLEGKNDRTIMLDTTMLYDERRLYFLRNIRGYDYSCLYLLKVKDVSVCLKRNKMRPKEKWVPEDVILNMNEHYKNASEETIACFNEFKEIYVD